MSLRISMGLLSIVLAGAFFAAQPKADTKDWMACTATPGRACVLDHALDVSRAMSTDSWRVNALISIAAAQAATQRRRETAAASEDAVQMLNVGGIDGRWRANALGRIAAAQSRAGLKTEAAVTIGDALQIIQSLGDDNGIRVFTDFDLVAMAGDQAEAGNSSEAMRVVQAITSEHLRARAIGAVARGQARAGDFTEALRTARLVAGRDAAEALKSIGDAQMQAGLRREAATTWAEASSSVPRSRFSSLSLRAEFELLVSIAESQAKAGLPQDARDTFDRALQAAQSDFPVINMAPPSAVQRIDAVIAVAEAEARSGMPGEAAEAFALAQRLVAALGQEDLRSSYRTDVAERRRQWQAYSFAALAAGQARAGLAKNATAAIEAAMPLAETISERVGLDHRGRDGVLSLIASAHASAGNVAAVMQIIPRLKQGWNRVEPIKALAKAGHVIEALRLAASVEDEGERAIILRSIAMEPSNANQLSQIKEMATSIRDGYSRARALGAVAQSQARAGLRSDAGQTIAEVVRIADEIKQDTSRRQTLAMVIGELCAFASELPD
jgi:tetratricopeptide (TPR) repeat protein